MRKEFASYLHKQMNKDSRIRLITADLGYGLWDRIKIDYPDRFYNVMSSEQLMIGLAVGMSMEKLLPVCYSITPFLLYRPFELIRNYINHENFNVKLVGGGRDQDYGYLGFSHWAEDDESIMSNFKNIKIHKPENITEEIMHDFLFDHNPSYLNLKK